MSAPVSDPVHLQGLTAPDQRRMGWYPDPLGAADLRWWNGNEWTSHIRPQTLELPRLEVAGLTGGILFPLVGFVIAIILLSRDRIGPGLACLASSCLGVVIWSALAASA